MYHTYNAATWATCSGNAMASLLTATKMWIRTWTCLIQSLHLIHSLKEMMAVVAVQDQNTKEFWAIPSALLAVRQVWLQQTSLSEEMKKDLTNQVEMSTGLCLVLKTVLWWKLGDLEKQEQLLCK